MSQSRELYALVYLAQPTEFADHPRGESPQSPRALDLERSLDAGELRAAWSRELSRDAWRAARRVAGGPRHPYKSPEQRSLGTSTHNTLSAFNLNDGLTL